MRSHRCQSGVARLWQPQGHILEVCQKGEGSIELLAPKCIWLTVGMTSQGSPQMITVSDRMRRDSGVDGGPSTARNRRHRIASSYMSGIMLRTTSCKSDAQCCRQIVYHRHLNDEHILLKLLYPASSRSWVVNAVRAGSSVRQCMIISIFQMAEIRQIGGTKCDRRLSAEILYV
jgi:hypothetical protein